MGLQLRLDECLHFLPLVSKVATGGAADIHGDIRVGDAVSLVSRHKHLLETQHLRVLSTFAVPQNRARSNMLTRQTAVRFEREGEYLDAGGWLRG